MWNLGGLRFPADAEWPPKYASIRSGQQETAASIGNLHTRSCGRLQVQRRFLQRRFSGSVVVWACTGDNRRDTAVPRSRG
jgi:hypothetical protein